MPVRNDRETRGHATVVTDEGSDGAPNRRAAIARGSWVFGCGFPGKTGQPRARIMVDDKRGVARSMKNRRAMKTPLLISGIVLAGCVGDVPDQRDVPSSTVEA